MNLCHAKTNGCLWSGQLGCHDAGGLYISCEGSGQDAESQLVLDYATERDPAPRAHCSITILSGLCVARVFVLLITCINNIILTTCCLHENNIFRAF